MRTLAIGIAQRVVSTQVHEIKGGDNDNEERHEGDKGGQI